MSRGVWGGVWWRHWMCVATTSRARLIKDCQIKNSQHDNRNCIAIGLVPGAKKKRCTRAHHIRYTLARLTEFWRLGSLVVRWVRCANAPSRNWMDAAACPMGTAGRIWRLRRRRLVFRGFPAWPKTGVILLSVKILIYYLYTTASGLARFRCEKSAGPEHRRCIVSKAVFGGGT